MSNREESEYAREWREEGQAAMSTHADKIRDAVAKLRMSYPGDTDLALVLEELGQYVAGGIDMICEGCGKDIEPGTDVTYFDGEPYCSTCAEDESDD